MIYVFLIYLSKYKRRIKLHWKIAKGIIKSQKLRQINLKYIKQVCFAWSSAEKIFVTCEINEWYRMSWKTNLGMLTGLWTSRHTCHTGRIWVFPKRSSERTPSLSNRPESTGQKKWFKKKKKKKSKQQAWDQSQRSKRKSDLILAFLRFLLTEVKSEASWVMSRVLPGKIEQSPMGSHRHIAFIQVSLGTITFK